MFNWIDRKTAASTTEQPQPAEQRSEYKTERLRVSSALSDYTRQAADYQREVADRLITLPVKVRTQCFYIIGHLV